MMKSTDKTNRTPLYELEGLNGRLLTGFPDRIVLSNLEADGVKNLQPPDTSIQITDIKSLQYQKAGPTSGFLELIRRGSHEDREIIEFDSPQNELAEKVYSHITSTFRESRSRDPR
ncbi:MAG: hypothetical protein FWG40_11720 [Peptococcaceae bacterium]|nr:hypothetical protein [Peptococcaceae bacterium]